MQLSYITSCIVFKIKNMNKLLVILCILYATKVCGQTDSTDYYLNLLQYKKSIDYIKRSIKKYDYIKNKNDRNKTLLNDINMTNLACAYSLNKEYKNCITQLNAFIKSKTRADGTYMGNGWSSSSYYALFYMDPDFYRVSTALPKEWKEFLIRHKNKYTISDTVFKKLNMPDSIFVDLCQIAINDQAHYREIKFYEEKYGEQSSTSLRLWESKDSLNKANLSLVLRYLNNGYNVLSDSIVGRFATKCFLVIQHADLKSQEKMLPIIKDLYERKQTSGGNYALLFDRVSVDKNKGTQYYGTQIDPRVNQPYFISDEKNVDKRRAELGMESMVEYCKRFDIIYSPKRKK